MAKRHHKRRGDRAAGSDHLGDRPDRGVYVIDLALEARLLGRFRLLTINAVIDVTEPASDRSALPGGAAARSPGTRRQARPAPPSPRRVEAEALLGDAKRALTTASNH
jgi:hypothetical protein